MTWKQTLKERLLSFHKELEEVSKNCARKPEDVKVVYATKYLNPDQFVEFLHVCKENNLLPVLIGENRIQSAREKIDYVDSKDCGLLDHFSMVMIGNLQKNKINKAIKLFEEIHAVDSLELAKELDKRMIRGIGNKGERRLSIFLEVNVSGEESKHGVKPVEVGDLIKSLKLLRSLKIKGLMTMAPHDDPEKVRPIFKTLRSLADKYHLLTSIGMSNDWKVAVEEGSDMVRIGSRIFE